MDDVVFDGRGGGPTSLEGTERLLTLPGESRSNRKAINYSCYLSPLAVYPQEQNIKTNNNYTSRQQYWPYKSLWIDDIAGNKCCGAHSDQVYKNPGSVFPLFWIEHIEYLIKAKLRLASIL